MVISLAAAAGLLLAACASSPGRPAAPPLVPKPIPLDASYDWHVLLLAPLGTVLKDVPFPLHEVLLFRDEAQSAAAADEAECYSTDAAAPRFIVRAPEEYLLCFKHDRLSRIEAAVRLPTSQAATDFAAACGLWLKNAAAAALPADRAPASAAQSNGAACEGNDSGIGFTAGLEAEPGADALLSIRLEASQR